MSKHNLVHLKLRNVNLNLLLKKSASPLEPNTRSSKRWKLCLFSFLLYTYLFVIYITVVPKEFSLCNLSPSRYNKMYLIEKIIVALPDRISSLPYHCTQLRQFRSLFWDFSNIWCWWTNLWLLPFNYMNISYLLHLINNYYIFLVFLNFF